MSKSNDRCPDCGRPFTGARRRCWKCHPGGKRARANGKPNLAGVFDGNGHAKPAASPFLEPITIRASDPPAPEPTVLIAPAGEPGPIALSRADRRRLIEQAHAVREARKAGAYAAPMPADEHLGLFRPGAIDPDDYVPRILDPPPPEEDEEPFSGDPPAPARRGPGRPAKYGAKPEDPAIPARIESPIMPILKPAKTPCCAKPSDPPAFEQSDADPGMLFPREPAMTFTPADPEIRAIAAVHAILADIDPAARRRVLAYVGSRFPSE